MKYSDAMRLCEVLYHDMFRYLEYCTVEYRRDLPFVAMSISLLLVMSTMMS